MDIGYQPGSGGYVPMNGYQPGYNPYPSSGYRTPYPNTGQTPVDMQQPGGLSKAELREAKRLAEEANFTFQGYQVLRKGFISHIYDPAMTVRAENISFNTACIRNLEDAQYVHFIINPDQQKLVIRRCDEFDRDAVRWCIVKEEGRKSRQILCRDFITQLRGLLGWNELYRYRFEAMRISPEGEPMYLIDLKYPEIFLPQRRDPETGKLMRPVVIKPEEWRNSFGLSVYEHAKSTEVNLNDGYFTATVTENRSVPVDSEAEEMDG